MNEQLSDRELDALVAEKVMGYEWRWVAFSGNAAGLVPSSEYQDRKRATANDPRCGDWLNFIPTYSTDISAAMEVIGAMLAKDYGWAFRSEGHGWTVEIFPLPDVGYNGVKIDDEALQRAICLAVLVAINGDAK